MDNYDRRIDRYGSQIWTFNVIGINKQNEDGTNRQDLLEKYSAMREAETGVEEYDRNGKPGYHVQLDRQTIGDVPGNVAIQFAELQKQDYLLLVVDVSFHGGPTEKNEDRPYGAEVTVRLVSPQEQTETGLQVVQSKLQTFGDLAGDGYTLRVAGVTFANDDGTSRQALLDDLQSEYDPDYDAELQRYEHDGAPAYYVLINDKIVGNVPKNIVPHIYALEQQGYRLTATNAAIYGGPDAEMPDRKFGCAITVQATKPVQVAQDVPHPVPQSTHTPAVAPQAPAAPQKRDAIASKLKKIQRFAILVAVIAFLGTALYSLLSKLWWAFWLR